MIPFVDMKCPLFLRNGISHTASPIRPPITEYSILQSEVLLLLTPLCHIIIAALYESFSGWTTCTCFFRTSIFPPSTGLRLIAKLKLSKKVSWGREQKSEEGAFVWKSSSRKKGGKYSMAIRPRGLERPPKTIARYSSRETEGWKAARREEAPLWLNGGPPLYSYYYEAKHKWVCTCVAWGSALYRTQKQFCDWNDILKTEQVLMF